MKEWKDLFRETAGLLIRILFAILPIVLLAALYHILF